MLPAKGNQHDDGNDEREDAQDAEQAPQIGGGTYLNELRVLGHLWVPD